MFRRGERAPGHDDPAREENSDGVVGGSGRAGYLLVGNPRFTPPWLGSSQREVTTLPRV